MNILGLETVTYGVREMEAAEACLTRYGLQPVEAPGGRRFVALDGTGVQLHALSSTCDAERQPGLWEYIWGVSAASDLDQIARRLRGTLGVRLGEDGVLRVQDPAGYTVGFQVTRRTAYRALAPLHNVAGEPPRRVNEAGWKVINQPVQLRSLAHIVLFVPDGGVFERFYVDALGFRASDRLDGGGVFLRSKLNDDHHQIFVFHAPGRTGIHHLACYVADIEEVIHAGQAFVQTGAVPTMGPGRHMVGSNYFWYFDIPLLGCELEYTADMDVCDDDWVPGPSMPMSLENAGIWVAPAGTVHPKYLANAEAAYVKPSTVP